MAMQINHQHSVFTSPTGPVEHLILGLGRWFFRILTTRTVEPQYSDVPRNWRNHIVTSGYR